MNMLAPQRRRLVIVGNGMAGIRTLEEILARAPHEFDVTVFGAEPHGNYIRALKIAASQRWLRRAVLHWALAVSFP